MGTSTSPPTNAICSLQALARRLEVGRINAWLWSAKCFVVSQGDLGGYCEETVLGRLTFCLFGFGSLLDPPAGAPCGLSILDQRIFLYVFGQHFACSCTPAFWASAR